MLTTTLRQPPTPVLNLVKNDRGEGQTDGVNTSMQWNRSNKAPNIQNALLALLPFSVVDGRPNHILANANPFGM